MGRVLPPTLRAVPGRSSPLSWAARRRGTCRLRAHYNIEDFLLFSQYSPFEHAHLHHYVLNPIFMRYRKHVLREVLRQWHKSCLYYRIYFPGDHDPTVQPYTLSPALTTLCPSAAAARLCTRWMSCVPTRRASRFATRWRPTRCCSSGRS